MDEQNQPLVNSEKPVTNNGAIDIGKNIVPALLGLVVVALMIYILTTKSTEEQKISEVVPIVSTTSPYQNSDLNVGTTSDIVSRVTITNALAEDEKWEITLKLLSINEQYAFKKKKWITEDAIFYHQTLYGNAADFEERKTQILQNVADIIASSSAKRNHQTLVSEEVIRLGQFRDSLLSTKQGQLSSFQGARATNSEGSANYSPQKAAELFGVYNTLLDILDEEILYIGYLIRVNKKLLEGINKGDTELVALASLDDILLRKIALWHESAYSNILAKQGNLQMELISTNLQTLSDSLNTLTEEVNSTATTTN